MLKKEKWNGLSATLEMTIYHYVYYSYLKGQYALYLGQFGGEEKNDGFYSNIYANGAFNLISMKSGLLISKLAIVMITSTEQCSPAVDYVMSHQGHQYFIICILKKLFKHVTVKCFCCGNHVHNHQCII